MISGVIFDAFGTTLHIGLRTNPYRQLLREGRRQGLTLGPEIIRKAMTADLSFEEFADSICIKLTHLQRAELADSLECELQSISPFSDALEAIERLQKLD